MHYHLRTEGTTQVYRILEEGETDGPWLCPVSGQEVAAGFPGGDTEPCPREDDDPARYADRHLWDGGGLPPLRSVLREYDADEGGKYTFEIAATICWGNQEQFEPRICRRGPVTRAPFEVNTIPEQPQLVVAVPGDNVGEVALYWTVLEAASLDVQYHYRYGSLAAFRGGFTPGSPPWNTINCTADDSKAYEPDADDPDMVVNATLPDDAANKPRWCRADLQNLPYAEYRFEVRGTNVVGLGPAKSATYPTAEQGVFAVTPHAVAPMAPTSLATLVGDGVITVSWVAPEDDGGAPVTGYEYCLFRTEHSDGSPCDPDGAAWTDADVTTGPALSDFSITVEQASPDSTPTDGRVDFVPLENGTEYTVRVRALNAQGTGPPASTEKVTPTPPPRAPSVLHVFVSDTLVALVWGAPPDGDAAVDRYEYRLRPGREDPLPWVDAEEDTQVTVPDLVNGLVYIFEVRAVNASGPSPPIIVAAIPGPPPESPVDLAATQTGGVVTLTWKAPDSGGRPIVRYDCEFKDAEASEYQLCPIQPGLETEAVIANLHAGRRYLMRVRACNVDAIPCPDGSLETLPNGAEVASSTGESAWAEIALVVGEVPGVPTAIASVADASVTVSWEAAPGEGGAVTRYEYRWGSATAPLGPWAIVTPPDGGERADAREVTVTGLANGVEYAFEVRAVNNFGAGEAASLKATPDAGLARVRLSLTPGERHITLAWEAVAGAENVTSYEYRWGRGSALGEWTGVGLETTVRVDGLETGVDYTFEVRARTEAGVGSAATEIGQAESPSAAGLPGVPISIVATPGDGQVGLRWVAPAPGAFPVSGYEYRWKLAGDDDAPFGTWSAAGTALAVAVGGLDNGVAYAFEVRAVNQAGNGPAARATATPSGTASAPRSLAAVATDGEVRLRWEAPDSDGGVPIVSYEYRYRAQDSRFGDWLAAGAETAVVVRELTNGVTYVFEVRAETATGAGSAASVNAVPVVAAAPPSVPRAFAAEALPGGTVTLTWSTPSSDGGAAVVRYELRWRVGDGEFGAWDNAGIATSRTLGNLVVGEDHTFEVRAVNAVGEGDSASVVARPARLPGTPSRLVATPAQAMVTLTWEAPENDGGAGIDRYEYRFGPSGGAFGEWRDAGETLSATVSSLDNGVEHAFEVRAVNDVGAGIEARVVATPAAVPGVPVASAFRRDSAALLRWEAPADDGGAPVLRYEYRWRAGTAEFGEWAVAGLALEASVGGLTNDVEHTFEVRAVNGTGAGEAATVRATPQAASAPAAPALTVIAGVRSVELAWEAPTDDGGSPIRGYEYRWQPAGDAFGAWQPTGSATTVTIDDLINGIEYVFEVRAVNDLGAGEVDMAAATPADVPGEPTLALVPTSGAVRLSWGAPEDDGGLAVEYYEYQWGPAGLEPGDWRSVGLATEATVRELVDGRTYAFSVRAINPRGAGPAATATATPSPGVAEDVLLRAWLSRFGRVAAGHVVGAVDARLRMPDDMPAPGRRSGPVGREGGADEQRRPRSRPGMERRPPDGREGGGRVRHRGGIGGRTATVSTSWAENLGRRMTDRVFRLSAPAAAGRWAAWGRLAASEVAGEEPRLGIDGLVATASGGVDYTQGGLLAGIALSHSIGRGDFRLLATDEFPARPGQEVESKMTGTYPYLRYARGAVSAWGLLGRGSGSVLLSGQGPSVETDFGSTLGAFGVRGALASLAGLDLALKSDAFLTRLATEGEAAAAVSADAARLRLLLEASRSTRLASGGMMTVAAEFGGRHDGGSAEKGGGMELGGGVSFGGDRVDVTARARTVLTHGDAFLREWGAMVTVAVRPAPSGRGFSMHIAPGWGNESSGVHALWATGRGGRGWTPEPVRQSAHARLGLEAGYSLDAFRGRALVTPYTRLRLGADGRDDVRLGWRLAATGARLEIEAIRGAAGDAGVLLRVTFNPWTAGGPGRPLRPPR